MDGCFRTAAILSPIVCGGHLRHKRQAARLGRGLDAACMSETPRIDLTQEPPFALGALTVRPATREVRLGVRREVLEPRVMQVLTALAHRRGEIVTREELIAACWEGRAVGDDAINRCIGRLRRLSEAFGGFSLETVARVGHRLTAEAAPAAPVDASSHPVLRRFHMPAAKRWLTVGAALLAAVTIGFAIWFWRSPARDAPVRPVRRAIAVLPFSPQSPGTQLFGDRVASAVAETLGKMGEPMVPTAESFQYRGAAKARAARELRALYVIDGEVSRENGKVRVLLHFVDTQKGTTLFAHSFEEPQERAEALPDRAAGYIASMFWGGDITVWSSDLAPGLLRALDQQRRGDFYAAYESARALAAAHPDHAGILCIYAWNALNLIATDPSARTAARLAEVRRTADKIRQLSPNTGDAYAIYAWITPDFLWGEREAFLRKALALSPGAVGTLMLQTRLLVEAGYVRDAEASARSAYDRFPSHETSAQRLAEQQLAVGNDAAARQVLAQARRLWPEDPTLLSLGFEAAAFSSAAGAAGAYLNDAAASADLPDDLLTAWRSTAKALHSRQAQDVRAMTPYCGMVRQSWWSCMMAYAKLGRLDYAYIIAAAVYPDLRGKDRAGVVRKWLAVSGLAPTRYLFLPATAAMRADPRFKDLVERIGLLQYWQSVHRPPDFCASEHVPVCRLIK